MIENFSIRKLNEELGKVLNEVSDTTKEKVFAKRKEQAAQAIAKLNKSAKIMAKSGVSKPSEIKITMTGGIADTFETKYNEGEIGGGSSWDNHQRNTLTLKLDNTLADVLADAVGEYLYCYWVEKNDITIRVEDDEIRLLFGTIANKENDEPSESELEEYKAGEISLWNVFGTINTEIAETEKPYFIKACEDAGIYVEEF